MFCPITLTDWVFTPLSFSPSLSRPLRLVKRNSSRQALLEPSCIDGPALYVFSGRNQTREQAPPSCAIRSGDRRRSLPRLVSCPISTGKLFILQESMKKHNTPEFLQYKTLSVLPYYCISWQLTI
ncbi:hypothetical protein PoB_001256500 [Plakobranchus ocellatus]|uniref:Uncharacterized protein n=1 Tax=Plakobranchus ocellatus TaxID=259542 RepID=A0AAV3YSD2_9GAST|nr:hypothetical protein PoB_001256500 [Plakobranchus ocellatus]